MTLYFKISIADIADPERAEEKDSNIYSLAIPLGESLPPRLKQALQEAASRSMEEEDGVLHPAMALALMGLLGAGMMNRLTGGDRRDEHYHN